MDPLEKIIYLTKSFVSFFKKGKNIKTMFQSIVLLLYLLGFFMLLFSRRKKTCISLYKSTFINQLFVKEVK